MPSNSCHGNREAGRIAKCYLWFLITISKSFFSVERVRTVIEDVLSEVFDVDTSIYYLFTYMYVPVHSGVDMIPNLCILMKRTVAA